MILLEDFFSLHSVSNLNKKKNFVSEKAQCVFFIYSN